MPFPPLALSLRPLVGVSNVVSFASFATFAVKLFSSFAPSASLAVKLIDEEIT
jgi:hypothetical protein